MSNVTQFVLFPFSWSRNCKFFVNVKYFIVLRVLPNYLYRITYIVRLETKCKDRSQNVIRFYKVEIEAIKAIKAIKCGKFDVNRRKQNSDMYITISCQISAVKSDSSFICILLYIRVIKIPVILNKYSLNLLFIQFDISFMNSCIETNSLKCCWQCTVPWIITEIYSRNLFNLVTIFA